MSRSRSQELTQTQVILLNVLHDASGEWLGLTEIVKRAGGTYPSNNHRDMIQRLVDEGFVERQLVERGIVQKVPQYRAVQMDSE